MSTEENTIPHKSLKEEQIKFGVEIAVSLHHRLRIAAAERRMSLKEATSQALEGWLTRKREVGAPQESLPPGHPPAGQEWILVPAKRTGQAQAWIACLDRHGEDTVLQILEMLEATDHKPGRKKKAG